MSLVCLLPGNLDSAVKFLIFFLVWILYVTVELE